MKSEIKVEVELDDNRQPTKIHWTAESQDGPVVKETKAMLLSFFDKESLETYKIDIWTNEMQVAEMDRLMFHTLRGLTDAYYNATKNEELSNQMRGFVDYFGKFTKIIPTDDTAQNS